MLQTFSLKAQKKHFSSSSSLPLALGPPGGQALIIYFVIRLPKVVHLTR